MKKSDIYICSFMYIFSICFLVLTLNFPLKARYYPFFVISLLIVLTSIKVFSMLKLYFKNKEIIDDIPNVFKGFIANQFINIFIPCILFLFLLYIVGFYIAAIIYLSYILHFFKIPTKFIFFIVLILCALIYGVFDIFLNVPLPMGLLFESLF